MVEVDFCGYVIFVFVYLMFKLGLVLGFYVFFYIFKVMLKVNMVMGSDGNNEWQDQVEFCLLFMDVILILIDMDFIFFQIL